MTQTFTRKIAKLSIGVASLAILVAPLGVRAADTTISVNVAGVLSTFTTSGTVTLGALTPNAAGRQSIDNDEVTVSTNDTDGYTLTLADADATRTLTSGSNSFAASTGTPASPIALINNSWGWRVDGLATFGAGGPTSAVANVAPSSATFAGIPATGTPFTINTNNTTGTEVTEVWYSARANDAQPTGTYTDIVTYTATVN